LDFSNELITLTLDDLPVIISQSAPLLFGFADELFPVSLDLVGVHLYSFVKLALFC